MTNISDASFPWATVDAPIVPDSDANELDLLRCHLTDSGFLVALWATPHCDRRGQMGIAVAIWETSGMKHGPDGSSWESERLVYFTGTEAGGLVYGSPGRADDSDQILIAAVHLCCHAAQHDDEERLVDPGWDAEALYSDASLLECLIEERCNAE